MANPKRQPHELDPPALVIHRLPGRYVICRMDPAAPTPEWADAGPGLHSVTHTDNELSLIVCDEVLPTQLDGIAVELGWVALRIAGQLDFKLVGVLAKLTGALAEAGVPVCAISTYDTDILLVKEADLQCAVAALSTVARVES